jgi:hypothetical protein
MGPPRPIPSQRQLPILHPLLDLDRLGLSVSNVAGKLPRRNALCEELVQFLITAALGLGVIEIEIDAAEDGETAKDERRLGSQVGLIRVEQVGQDKVPHTLQTVPEGLREAQ